MLKIDFTKLMADRVGDANGLTSEDLAEIAKAAKTAHEKVLQWRKSQDAIFFDIVSDNTIFDGIEDKANEVASSFENLVVLGIGGSALGMRCLASALLPPFWNLRNASERNNKPKLFVCDNIDPETFAALLEMVDIKKTCFIVISKSGSTTETAAQMHIAIQRLKDALGEGWQKNLIAITDPNQGHLRELCTKENLDSFSIPPKLGGRFSVLCPVGLFPAACVGIDVKALISGAKDMAARCEISDLEENPGYQIGGYHFWFDTKKAKHMSVMLPYSDALMLTADWYAQLWAESLGKDGKGQTPIKALGVTDQHSQVQLYMDGPLDKVFTFVGTESFKVPASFTQIHEASGAYEYLKGKDLGTIMHAEQKATAEALAKNGRPSLTVTFPKIDAQHLGEFFMLYEAATAFAGALYNINPFDQPGVELGKKLTREILSNP
ncbi:MAG: glucose-6-phosphate isomerase [Pseudomonadota bacterium]